MLVKLDTGFNIEVEFPISPFAKRLVAQFIDWAILLAYIWVGSKILSALTENVRGNVTWAWVILWLPVTIYHPALEIALNGQSIGKKAMSIRVIAEEGGQPTVSQYLIRWILRVVDFPVWVLAMISYGDLPWWCSLLLFSGIGAVLATEKSQRIGDIAAGTIVIDTKTRTSWQDTVFTELESTYQPRYPAVMRLSDKDVNTLKSIIETVKRKNDFDLAMRIADRIRTKLVIESDQDAPDFLETLLKDYNYYSTRNL